MKERKIGFVGVGRMGSNMARRLADLGYIISAIYDLHTHAAESLALELGCVAVKQANEVCSLCDVIFTVVTDDASMDELYFGSDSLLQDATGRIFLNCATLSPSVQEKTANAITEAGGFSLAVSMASSISQARQGTLYLIIGGEAEVFTQVEELLHDLATNVRHVGPVGNAARVKALVNMVMNINTAALAEGLGLGAALGLDMEMLREIFSQTGACSRVLETDGKDMVMRDYACYFSAAHAAKDSRIATDMAFSAGINAPLSTAAQLQFEKLVELGLGEQDKSAVAELTFLGRAGGQRS